MAFHPFHFFRKRQKTFLAILTIFLWLYGLVGVCIDGARMASPGG